MQSSLQERSKTKLRGRTAPLDIAWVLPYSTGSFSLSSAGLRLRLRLRLRVRLRERERDADRDLQAAAE